jgi:hypothetical protein
MLMAIGTLQSHVPGAKANELQFLIHLVSVTFKNRVFLLVWNSSLIPLTISNHIWT